MTCLACGAPTLEQGHYAGALCLDHALVAAKAKRGRGPALAEHDALHRAFKTRNRHLVDLGPATTHAPSTADAMPPELLEAVVIAMQGLGARPIHTAPRYGDLPPGVRPIASTDDPLEPCAQCGATGRTKRAPYGLGGGQVWVLCQAPDACYARLRKAKAA